MAARKPRYRTITVAVSLRVHNGVTTAEAKREMKTRVNDLSGYYSTVASGREMLEGDVRIKRITRCPSA